MSALKERERLVPYLYEVRTLIVCGIALAISFDECAGIDARNISFPRCVEISWHEGARKIE